MYATTDGGGAGFGYAQLWQSKDLVNWTLMPMNWPDSHWIWAARRASQCQRRQVLLCVLPALSDSCGRGRDSPRLWKNILGESEAVLVPDRFVTNAITLDGQTFVDGVTDPYICTGAHGEYMTASDAARET